MYGIWGNFLFFSRYICQANIAHLFRVEIHLTVVWNSAWSHITLLQRWVTWSILSLWSWVTWSIMSLWSWVTWYHHRGKVSSSFRRYDIVELKHPKWPSSEFKYLQGVLVQMSNFHLDIFMGWIKTRHKVCSSINCAFHHL